MKLSFLMLSLVLAFSSLNAADSKPRTSSYDDVDGQFAKPAAKKPKAVGQIVSKDEVVMYALDKVDPRITSGELDKMSKEDKAKALQEIDLQTAKVGKEIARYDLKKRSLDSDEATSAWWGWRRWGWGWGGGWGCGGCGWGGGVTFVNAFVSPCLYSTAFVGSAYFW